MCSLASRAPIQSRVHLQLPVIPKQNPHAPVEPGRQLAALVRVHIEQLLPDRKQHEVAPPPPGAVLEIVVIGVVPQGEPLLLVVPHQVGRPVAVPHVPHEKPVVAPAEGDRLLQVGARVPLPGDVAGEPLGVVRLHELPRRLDERGHLLQPARVPLLEDVVPRQRDLALLPPLLLLPVLRPARLRGLLAPAELQQDSVELLLHPLQPILDRLPSVLDDKLKRIGFVFGVLTKTLFKL